MDRHALFAQLQAERPAAIPAVKAFIAAVTPENREAANQILHTLLQMQHDLDHKRRIAVSMLRNDPFAHNVPGKADLTTRLRHVPDVMIRKLCVIAEVEHHTNARPEWLDEMEARHANR